MSELQFYILVTAIVTGLGGIMTVIRWSVGLISKTIGANTTAMMENTKSNAVLSTKIDRISEWVEKRGTGQQVPFKKRGRTSPHGNPIGSKIEDEE